MDQFELGFKEDIREMKNEFKEMSGDMKDVIAWMNRVKGWAAAAVMVAGILGAVFTHLIGKLFTA